MVRVNSESAQLEARVKETVLRLPLVVGNAAVNWIVDSFRVGGFRTVSRFGTAWQARKDTRKKNNGRNILVGRGNLRRSIRILSITGNSVSIGSDLAYAAIHNQGFNGTETVRAHTRGKYAKAKVYSIKSHRAQTVSTKTGDTQVKSFTRNMHMPKRQFMPNTSADSPVFIQDMEAVIKQELEPLFNP